MLLLLLLLPLPFYIDGGNLGVGGCVQCAEGIVQQVPHASWVECLGQLIARPAQDGVDDITGCSSRGQGSSSRGEGGSSSNKGRQRAIRVLIVFMVLIMFMVLVVFMVLSVHSAQCSWCS